ncbi:hypothetical protein pb186bvf_016253 [Paramecium bursaria]
MCDIPSQNLQILYLFTFKEQNELIFLESLSNLKSNMKQMKVQQYKELLKSSEMITSDILTIRQKQLVKKQFILLPNILVMAQEDKPEHIILSNCSIEQHQYMGLFPLELQDSNGSTFLLFGDEENNRIWYKLLKRYCKQINFFEKYQIESKMIPGFYKCRNKKRGTEQLVQFYKNEELYQNIELWEAVHNEIQILRSIKHQGFLEVKEVFEDPNYLFIVYEDYSGESLAQLLQKGTQFDDIQSASLMYQIMQCLKFLNIHQFYHANLNPCNILIDTNSYLLTVNIINLSFKEYKIVDKLDWLIDRNFEAFTAPEIFQGQQPTIISDLYSVGAILQYLSFYSYDKDIRNFKDIVRYLDLFKINNAIIEEHQQYLINVQQNCLPQNQNSISQSRIELIKKLLKTNSNERPTIQEVTKHQWFVNIKNKQKTSQIKRKVKRPLPSLRTIIELREQSEQDLRMTIIQSVIHVPSAFQQFGSKLEGTICSDEEEEDQLVVHQKMLKLNQNYEKHPSMK